MSQLIYQALHYATVKHRGQKRKVSNADYIIHPILTSYLVAQYKRSKNLENLICAAILHDTVEDTNATYNDILKRFGMPIAMLVFELTSDEKEVKKLGKLEYLKKKMTGMSSYGLFLKLCDRLANMMDCPTERQKEETRAILAYLNSNRKLSRSHIAVMEEIEKAIG